MTDGFNDATSQSNQRAYEAEALRSEVLFLLNPSKDAAKSLADSYSRERESFGRDRVPYYRAYSLGKAELGEVAPALEESLSRDFSTFVSDSHIKPSLGRSLLIVAKMFARDSSSSSQ